MLATPNGDVDASNRARNVKRIKDLIDRNKLVLRKANSTGVRIMHQKDIHARRIVDLMEAATKRLMEIERMAYAELDASQRSHERRLIELQDQCNSLTITLRGALDKVTVGHGVSFADLNQLHETLTFSEQTVESLSNYEMILSPTLQKFFEEPKLIYVRGSPLFPSNVTLASAPTYKADKLAKFLIFTAVPTQYEPRLDELLTARLEKLDSDSQGGATASASQSKRNEIPEAFKQLSGTNGVVEIGFILSQFERGKASGIYRVHVELYGRPIKNTPQTVRVHPDTDAVTVQTSENTADHHDEDEGGHGDGDDTITLIRLVPPPPAYADPPPSAAANGNFAQDIENRSSQAASEREAKNSHPQHAIEPEVAPVVEIRTTAPPAALLFDTIFPPPPPAFADHSQPKPPFVGVGRGRPSRKPTSPGTGGQGTGPSSAPTASKPAPHHELDEFEKMEEYQKRVVTEPKTIPEKDIGDDDGSGELMAAMASIRLPTAASPAKTTVADPPRFLPAPLAFDDGERFEFGSTTASIADHSRGLLDDTMDQSFAYDEFRSQSQFERPIGVFGQGASGGGRDDLRPDMRYLLGGPESSRRDVTGVRIMTFGYERRQEPADRCFSFPIGCTKDSISGDYIICDTGHHVVKIFDNGGQLIHVNENLFKRPAAVVSLDGKLYAVRDDRCIQIFSKDGRLVRTAGEDSPGRAYGLALDKDGNLVTVELGGRRGQSFILRFDPGSGREVSRVPYTAHIGKANSKCRFIDCFNTQLYVADLGASLIYCTDIIEGTNLLEFGGFTNIKDRELGKFNEPSGISADRDGNLFIGDSRNDRILIFRPSGQYVGLVKFDHPIKRPSGIHLTNDGNLMVMNYVAHYVSLFKLQQ